VEYFNNPARDRLRRCPHPCPKCRGWFVDTTRNKSARRCSRECTIAWSNSQRKKKGGAR
jgi:predicted RNA-binding Zn ribbon-like protein